MSKQIVWQTGLVIVGVFCLGMSSWAHRGGLDDLGGHSTGDEYHFHKGALKNQSFPTKEKAREALAQGKVQPTLKLASFNIRIFSNKSRNKTELKKIVKQLQPYDIIAIQEVRDSQVLDRALTLLEENTGVVWAYEVSEKVGNKVKERYAFMYRTDCINVITVGRWLEMTRNCSYESHTMQHLRPGNLILHSSPFTPSTSQKMPKNGVKNSRPWGRFC